MMYRLLLARAMKGASRLDLRGKTLIVTGASRGIGRALALELAQNGVNLVLNARSEAPLEEAATAARGKGVNTLTVVGDAALASNAREMVKAAVGIGEFVGFIHNAELFILVHSCTNYLKPCLRMSGDPTC